MPFIDNELYDDIALTECFGGRPTTATLKKWRTKGIGPKFIRVGRRVLYRGSDINAWLSSRTVSHTNSRMVPMSTGQALKRRR